MGGRFVWWRTGPAGEDPTLAAAPGRNVTPPDKLFNYNFRHGKLPCPEQEMVVKMFVTFVLSSSDLVVAAALAAGAAEATGAGAPGVAPDLTPGEDGHNLEKMGRKYRLKF